MGGSGAGATERTRDLVHLGSWLALWALLSAVGAFGRPLLPIDETRSAAVVWDLWQRGDWLVPHLNGAPYSQKPPLLFWTALAGWRVFGVSEAWLRALGPLFALASLLLTVGLCRRLAPDRPDAARRVGWILLGTGLWSILGSVFMFDTLLALCTLLALHGVVAAARGRVAGGFALAGVGLGLGILAKGPVVFVHVLPAALLAPWWSRNPVRPLRWYAGTAAAVGLGVAIALAWALPAASQGGATYANELLWQQTAGRMRQSFAHAEPVWWYLPWLPLVALPWSLVPGVFRVPVGSGPTRRERDPAARFALGVLLPGLLILSLVSGKNLNYVVPQLPALALLLGLWSERWPSTSRWRLRDRLAPTFVFATAGIALAVLACVPSLGWPHLGALAGWTKDVPLWPAALPLGAAVLVLLGGGRIGSLPALSSATGLLLVGLLLSVPPGLRAHYDMQPMAQRISTWQWEGRPVAITGGYHGQYDFTGRLPRRLDTIHADEVRPWAEAHPDGVLLTVERSWPVPGAPVPIATAPFRGRTAVAWDASDILASSLWPASRGESGSGAAEKSAG